MLRGKEVLIRLIRFFIILLNRLLWQVIFAAEWDMILLLVVMIAMHEQLNRKTAHTSP